MASLRAARALAQLLALLCGACVPTRASTGQDPSALTTGANVGAVRGPPPLDAEPRDAEPRDLSPEERKAEFGFVVDVLRDSYAHLELKEHQWGVRLDDQTRKHAPRVFEAAGLRGYYDALSEFLAEFHDGHLRLVHQLPPFESTARPARAGFETRFLAGRLLVTDVWPRSHAARAGLRPGDEVIAVDGETVEQLFARFQTSGSWSRLERARFLFERQWSIRAVEARGSVPALPITRRRDDGSYATLRVPLETESSYRLDEAPLALHDLTSHYRLDLRTLLLDRSQVEKEMLAVRERIAAAPRPLLIDLRGNPGGYDNAAREVAGSFTARGVTGAVLRMHLSERVLQHRPEWATLPRDPARPPWSLAQPFHAPGLARAEFPHAVAVLTDAGCISSCETLTLLLRALGARVFGARTAGSSGGPIQVRLPHSGAALGVPAWSVEDLQGRPLEGLGVDPDERVEAEPEHVARGEDTAAHAALGWLRSTAGLHRDPEPRKLGDGCDPPSFSSISMAP